MKRFLASALIVGVSTFGLVGCEDTSKVETKTTTETPSGTTTEKKTEEIKQSGEAPPAPATTPEAPATTPAPAAEPPK